MWSDLRQPRRHCGAPGVSRNGREVMAAENVSCRAPLFGSRACDAGSPQVVFWRQRRFAVCPPRQAQMLGGEGTAMVNDLPSPRGGADPALRAGPRAVRTAACGVAERARQSGRGEQHGDRGAGCSARLWADACAGRLHRRPVTRRSSRCAVRSRSASPILHR